MTRARSVIALLLVPGCALFGPSVAKWVAAPAARKSQGPALPRRDDCLKAPFTLEHSRAITLAGLRIEQRGDGPRELTVSTLSGGVAEADDLLAFTARNQAKLHAIDGVESSGLSGCPSGAKGPVPCIALGVRVCEQPLDQLAASLRELIDADADAKGRQLVFHVTLVGAIGPRCEESDARCRPEPYEGAFYRVGARRGLLSAPPADAEPECQSDGECKKSGCGNACAPWTTAHQVGTCEERAELRDALCGCVEQQCAWFVQ